MLCFNACMQLLLVHYMGFLNAGARTFLSSSTSSSTAEFSQEERPWRRLRPYSIASLPYLHQHMPCNTLLNTTRRTDCIIFYAFSVITYMGHAQIRRPCQCLIPVCLSACAANACYRGLDMCRGRGKVLPVKAAVASARSLGRWGVHALQVVDDVLGRGLQRVYVQACATTRSLQEAEGNPCHMSSRDMQRCPAMVNP